MHTIVHCVKCHKQLKVREETLGKRGRCPACKTVFELKTASDQRRAPGAAPPPPRKSAEAQWFVGSHDGNEYGPISKDELDSWVADGSVSSDCHLFREGDSDWRPAADVYPVLAAGAAQLTEAGSANVWNVIDSVNLYHTGIGVCDWQIHLCEEGILAIPEGMKNALAAGLAAGVAGGAGTVVKNPLVNALMRGVPQQIADEGEPKWMRFPLDQIKAVVVQKKMLGGSRLFVELADGTQQKFATDAALATHQARYVIGTVYKDWYREEKFKRPVDRSKAFR